MAISNRASALLLSLFAALFIAACNSGGGGGGGGDGDQNGGSTPLDAVSALQLTLDGAQGLVVTGDNGVATAAAAVDLQGFDADDYLVTAEDQVDLEPNSLYKATVDGRLERVSWTSEDGDELPPGTIVPKVVTELNNRFVAIGFQQTIEGGEVLKLAFLAEKSTGFAYSEDPYNPGPLYLNTFEEPGKITTDRYGNIYLEGFLPGMERDGTVGIYRIDVSAVGTGENVEATLISGTDNGIYFWEVPHHGRFVAYAGSTAEGHEAHRLRRTDAAGFDNVDIPLGNRMILGADGEVYAFYLDPGYNDADNKLYRLDLQVTESDVTAELAEMVRAEDTPLIMLPFNSERRVVAGRLIVPNGLDNTPYEVRPRQGYSRPVPELEGVFSNIRNYFATERFLFFFADTTEAAPEGEANGVIIRWDGSSGELVQLDLPEQFDLLEFEVLSDSRVWVRAVERATDSTVIGEISVAGAFTETTRVPGTLEVLTLTPINPAQFIVVDGLAQDWPSDLLIATSGSGTVDAVGAVADRGELKLLVRTTELPEDGVRLKLDDGAVVHTLVYEASQAVYQYVSSMDGTPVNVAEQGWLAAAGPDGFEFSIPLDALAEGATQVAVSAELAEVDDAESPVRVDPTGGSIGPATYVLP